MKLTPAAIIRFIQHDIWHLKPKDEDSALKKRGLHTLKVAIFAYQGFIRDDVQLRASALTFYSLLSIVPVMAMAFGIAKGFEMEKQFQTKLEENFSGQAEVIDKTIEFAQKLLENTQGGLIAGIGFAVLLYSVIKLFTNIEQSFNQIWTVEKERTIVRKMTDYLAMVLLSPLFLVAASSLTVQIKMFTESLTQSVEFLSLFEWLIFPALRLLPFMVIWALFTLLYIIFPNTKVNLKSAFIAAVVAGSAYQITQWALINFQVGVGRYNAIYGSFAALPLFLFWLQLSWLIILFGAELSYAHQNVGDYESENQYQSLSIRTRKSVMLAISKLIIEGFNQGKAPLTALDVSNNLEIPSKLTIQLTHELVEAGVLSPVQLNDDSPITYQPAKNPVLLQDDEIILRFEDRGQKLDWGNLA